MNILNKNFLANELVKWQESGLVDRLTAQRIAQSYGIDLQNISDKNSLILKLVAYLFFALSLITLVGANWEEIPRIARLIIVVSVTAFVNLGAFYMLKKGNESQSTALFFLGNFCYGAAIALIAQIYHLGEHMPNGILLWAIGAFAIALSSEKSIITAQALIIALIWFILELELKTLSHGIVIFFALSIFSLLKEESRLLTSALFVGIFIYLVSDITNYYGGSEFWLITSNNLILLSLGYLLLCLGISFALEHFNRFLTAEYLRKASISIGLFTLLFAMTTDSIRYYGYEPQMNDVFIFYKGFYGTMYLAFVCGALALSLIFRRFYTAGLCVVMLILPLVIGYAFEYTDAVYSFLSVLAGVVLIKQDYVKLGLFAIFAVAIVRYIDLIGDYIGASLLFLGFAVTVLVVSRKKRAK
ncbi:DUF2157 domain-containing protein [Campylobacter sp. CCUG 57310]|uniref:DUF2157 domain-containing protein n=1 Tax=Campylobacter sp. CCUG 57310 TaxID=2517362 RepID=UPI0015661A3B|nr:DUF2157 domain-containing protein [Campylobacter sp. CCUG 57310]QKF92173.1 DUF2157 domain-containing membrane protein [Campylobacter sp. CCUG 57310]